MIFEEITNEQRNTILDDANKAHVPYSDSWYLFLMDKIFDHFVEQAFGDIRDSYEVLCENKKPATGGFLNVLKQHPKSPSIRGAIAR